MDWYKSQTITTAILAACNIGVLAALATGIVSVLVMQRLALAELSMTEGAVVKLTAIAAGIVVAALVDKQIMLAIRSLSRIWSSVLFLFLVVSTLINVNTDQACPETRTTP